MFITLLARLAFSTGREGHEIPHFPLNIHNECTVSGRGASGAMT